MITFSETFLSKTPVFASIPGGDSLFPANGFMVVDQHYNVIAVDEGYKMFHKLFHQTVLNAGDNIYLQVANYYPTNFNAALRNSIEQNEDDLSLTLDYKGEFSSSFKVSIDQLQHPINCKGARIIIERTEADDDDKQEEKSESFFRQLVDHSTNIYQLTDSSFNISYSSNAVEEELGYNASELFDKNVIDLVHPDDIDLVKEWFVNIKRQSEKLLTLEYRVRAKKGNYIWIENSAKNMLNNLGFRSIVMNSKNIQEKKIADDALVQAEQRLSLLLNNTAESFIILNSRLRIVTYNKSAQERSPYFYNKEIQSGFSVLDLIDEAEIQDYITLFEQVFNGEEKEKETRYIDEQGKSHIYSHTFRPLFNAGNDIFGVFITSSEVTERKNLTEQVAINSERLKTAQKIARLGYFEFDAHTKTFFCSDQFYEILEIDKSVQSWDELRVYEKNIHNQDKKNVITEISNSLINEADFYLEFRYFVNGEREKVILAIGGVETSKLDNSKVFKVTLQDITETRMAMVALQALESKFKSIFDNSIDGVVLSNHTGELLSANPAACKMLGYTQQEMSTLVRTDLLDVESRSVQEMIYKQNTLGEFVGELNFKHKKGHYVPVEISSISMKDANGKNYVSTIVRDITDKKKIEEDQRLLTDELLKNNQDLQQFSFITSHNLRAPVANLLSLLSLYNKENHADEFNQVLVDKFEQATQQLNSTLNDLVNVLVIKSNNNIDKVPISFTSVFTEVRKNVDNLLHERKGKIHADFTAVDEILYNKIHIDSIFLNMITNAIRYSSPDRKPEIKITSHKMNGWVMVSFSDNGLGMDLKRYGDRLFGLYQRFHGNIEGKGLGLYMTKSQITAMGGKIEVESSPDKGTTFKIFFKTQAVA